MNQKMLSLRALAPLMFTAFLALSAQAAETVSPAIDPQANEVLTKLSDFYSRINAFTVSTDFKMHVQMPGSRREAWAAYDISIERPNRAAFLIKDGVGAAVVSDGKKLYAYVPALNKYSQSPAPASLDALATRPEMTLINNSVGDLFVIDDLMQSDPRKALLDEISAVKYIGLENVDGIQAHHLQFARRDFSRDLWIQDGNQPFVLKAAPDLSKALAEASKTNPQMKNSKMTMAVTFKAWTIKPNLPDQAFAFSPPEKAQEVASFFEKEESSALLGKPAPAIAADLAGGGQLNLADLKGRVVILDFWATWCVPCLDSLPITSELGQTYAEKGVRYFSIDQEEAPEKISQFLKERKWSFPVVLDRDGKLSTAYSVKGIPFTVVIDKNGIVQHVHMGMDPNLKSQLTKEVDALLAAEAIPASAEQPQR